MFPKDGWQYAKKLGIGTLKAIRLVWETNKSLTISIGFTTVILAIFPAANAWIGKLIIDTVVKASNGNNNISDVYSLILLVFVISSISQLLSGLSQTQQDQLRDLLGEKVNLMVIEKALNLDLSFFETPSFYDILQRAQQEAGYRPLSLLQQIFSLFRNLITFISLAGLLVYFNYWAILILLLTCFPFLVFQVKYGNSSFKVNKAKSTEWRKLLYFSSLLTTKLYVKEVKLFNLAKDILNRYKLTYSSIIEKNRTLSIKKNFGGSILQIISQAGYYIIYSTIVIDVLNGKLSLGDLMMLSSIVLQFQSLTSAIMMNFSDLYEQNLFLSNFFSYLEIKPLISNITIHPPLYHAFINKIEFCNVSFQYPGSSRYVLKNVSFQLKSGEKIALVGANGAGKTTIIKLLTRLYDPTEGRIILDDIDLRFLDINCLQNQIGVIFQDYVQYYLSAKDNIGFGKVAGLNNRDDIIEAAIKSGIHSTLTRLPKGYDTELGRIFDDNGAELSVGQWQKVALARAYMKDSPILILDEPTASLDAISEYEVYKQIRELMKNKTVILITHRFSTARIADRIFVLDQGQIVEHGSHDELIKMEGKYAHMFGLQAEGYK